MLKARIQKGQESVVEATGTAQEIVADIVFLVNAIHTQFKNADPSTAEQFRIYLTDIANTPNSQMWEPLDGQTGIIFPKPKED